MIIVTTENIPGCRVVRVLGEVFGLTVRTRGLGGNVAAGFRSLAGGEVRSYTKLLEETRQHAIERLVENATAMGANAITMMRFDSNEMGGTMSEIVAYGTAVIVEFAQPVAEQQHAVQPAGAGARPAPGPAPAAAPSAPGAGPPPAG